MKKRLRAAGFLSGLFLVILLFGVSQAEDRNVRETDAEQSAKFLEMLKERGLAPKILNEKTAVDLREWPACRRSD